MVLGWPFKNFVHQLKHFDNDDPLHSRKEIKPVFPSPSLKIKSPFPNAKTKICFSFVPIRLCSFSGILSKCVGENFTKLDSTYILFVFGIYTSIEKVIDLERALHKYIPTLFTR